MRFSTLTFYHEVSHLADRVVANLPAGPRFAYNFVLLYSAYVGHLRQMS